jgi:hypothetical protein
MLHDDDDDDDDDEAKNSVMARMATCPASSIGYP